MSPKCIIKCYFQNHSDFHKLSSLAGIACGAVDVPEHGSMRCSEGDSYNSVCTFSCAEGYHLLGSESRTCLGRGAWTGAHPTCICKHFQSVVGLPFIPAECWRFKPNVLHSNTVWTTGSSAARLSGVHQQRLVRIRMLRVMQRWFHAGRLIYSSVHSKGWMGRLAPNMRLWVNPLLNGCTTQFRLFFKMGGFAITSEPFWLFSRNLYLLTDELISLHKAQTAFRCAEIV